jgi:hypothetical protein
MRERVQAVARSLDPSHRFGLLCRTAPQTRYVYLIPWLTKSKHRLTQTYTANSPAQRHYDRLAFCRSVVDCCGNRCNRRFAEFAKKKVRLEVRNRSQEKSARRLQPGLQAGSARSVKHEVRKDTRCRRSELLRGRRTWRIDVRGRGKCTPLRRDFPEPGLNGDLLPAP